MACQENLQKGRCAESETAEREAENAWVFPKAVAFSVDFGQVRNIISQPLHLTKVAQNILTLPAQDLRASRPFRHEQRAHTAGLSDGEMDTEEVCACRALLPAQPTRGRLPPESAGQRQPGTIGPSCTSGAGLVQRACATGTCSQPGGFETGPLQ